MPTRAMDANELEFHLATLLQDLRIIELSLSGSRETWVHTGLPRITHASALCRVIGEWLEPDRSASLMALAVAVADVTASKIRTTKRRRARHERCGGRLSQCAAHVRKERVGVGPRTGQRFQLSLALARAIPSAVKSYRDS